MQPRSRIILPVVALGVVLAVAPAAAAKPQPVSLGTPSSPSRPAAPGSVQGITRCPLGVEGPAANIYGYILPPDDGYYTLIDPRTCPGPLCNPPGPYTRVILYAHMELFFTEPCDIPVTVSVVPAIEVAPGCLAPNPFAPVLCQPVTYVINDAGQNNLCGEYALAIAPGCCIAGPTFLAIEFDQGTCPDNRPAFCGPTACTNCTQYNFYPGVPAPGDDLCAILAPFGLTGNIMWAESDCCYHDPITPGSWGKLKTIYR